MSTEILTILFGIGVLQVLLTAPGGIVEQFPRDMARLGRKLIGPLHKGSTPAASTEEEERAALTAVEEPAG